MAHPSWIDSDSYENKIGDLRYLVETLNTSNGRTSWSLYERPLRTNQSHQPRLNGWCGETDNRSRYARGVVRVMALNAAGDRCRIAQVTGDELQAFLERDGFPACVGYVTPATE